MTMSLMRRATDSNSFIIGPNFNACESVMLWLSPEYVDLNREIVIQGRGDFKGIVTASRRVMLEDVRRRADTRHPFWARLIQQEKRWIIDE
jgi:hypothetical protein